MTKQKLLIDTNILVYAFDSSSPYHQTGASILRLCFKQKISGHITHQNITEFSKVFIEKYKISPLKLKPEIRKITHRLNLELILPTPQTLPHFIKLLKFSKVKGTHIFDLYLAATMLSNRINKIITFNTKDFAPIPELQTHHPLDGSF